MGYPLWRRLQQRYTGGTPGGLQLGRLGCHYHQPECFSTSLSGGCDRQHILRPSRSLPIGLPGLSRRYKLVRFHAAAHKSVYDPGHEPGGSRVGTYGTTERQRSYDVGKHSSCTPSHQSCNRLFRVQPPPLLPLHWHSRCVNRPDL